MTRATRIDLATIAHRRAGVDAYLEVRPIVQSVPGGLTDATVCTAYVCASGQQRQVIGTAVNERDVEQLRVQALAGASAIAAEQTPPPAAAAAKPAKKKARKAAAPTEPTKIITNLSNSIRAAYGIRCWLESVTTREGRRSVTEHQGFVEAPGREIYQTGIFASSLNAVSMVDNECALLIAELASVAA